MGEGRSGGFVPAAAARRGHRRARWSAAGFYGGFTRGAPLRHSRFTRRGATAAPSHPMEPLMLADVLYFAGGLAAFALVALCVPLAGRL